jgi:hypothetical protein
MTQSIIGRLKTLLMRKRGSFRGKLRSCLMRIKGRRGMGWRRMRSLRSMRKSLMFSLIGRMGKL